MVTNSVTEPLAPTSVSVSSITTDSLTLSWGRALQDGIAETYKYSYIDRSNSNAASGMMDVSGTSVAVSVTAGHQYTFSVYTVRYGEISEASTGVDVTAGELWTLSVQLYLLKYVNEFTFKLLYVHQHK